MHRIEEDPEAGVSRRYDWRGPGALLQTDPASVQHVQKQKMYLMWDLVNIGDKIDYGQRKNENLSDLIQETL